MARSAPSTRDHSADAEHGSMRIDKWLWAARFFKTRSLAKDAIEGGKVHAHGERVKVSKEIRVGLELTIRQGFEEKTVEVVALSAIRGAASAAQLLYTETPTSVAKRELIAAHRKLSNLARPDHKPSKRDRRQIHRFQHDNQQSFNTSYGSDDDGH